LTEIGPGDEELIRVASLARQRAHAPYSKYKVGAAIRTKRNRVHSGANVENASYGLTVCAERNAVAAAVAAGAKRIRAVAVVTRDGSSPCGACRQVLAELGGPTTEVLLASPAGAPVGHTLGALLPHAFTF